MKALLQSLMSGKTLSRAEAAFALDLMLEGKEAPECIGAFLAILRLRKETPAEIAGFAEALLKRCVPFPDAGVEAIDTCGTGGDGAGTFNISTTVSFVVAGAGCPVAKHGNRSVSSRSGSADVLEFLNVPLIQSPEAASRALRETGFVFLFATDYHPHLRQVAAIRKNLGLRTTFNLLGPLVNPARVKRQVVGVFDEALLGTLAEVLGSLGAEEALVVRGEDGLDEISLCAPTQVAHWKSGRVTKSLMKPEDVGFACVPIEALRGGDAQENARLLEGVLSGQVRGAKRDVVLLNAGAALWVAGKASDWKQGVALASQTIDSGKALAVLNRARGA